MPGHDGVHVTHCCAVHGCKYGLSNCPVTRGRLKQEYACEEGEYGEPCFPEDVRRDAIEAALDQRMSTYPRPPGPLSEADEKAHAGLIELLRKWESETAEFYYDFYKSLEAEK